MRSPAERERNTSSQLWEGRGVPHQWAFSKTHASKCSAVFQLEMCLGFTFCAQHWRNGC